MCDLTIVIINYETPVLVKNLVESIFDTVKSLDYEIVVVDNSKNEDLRFKSSSKLVKVLNLNENRGFAHANNYGVRNSNGRYILFLNSDSIVYENSIELAYSYFLQQKKVGVLGIRQLLKNGELDKGCKRGFPTPMAAFYYFLGFSKWFKNSKRFGVYQQTFIDEFEVAEVDSVSGAFMLIKRTVFNLICGFDERFFLYGEDVDLCYRLKQHGFKNIYFGKVYFTHLKNGSGAGSLRTIKYFYDSMKIFYNKHYKKKYCILVNFVVKLAIELKYILSVCIFLKKCVFAKKERINGNG